MEYRQHLLTALVVVVVVVRGEARCEANPNASFNSVSNSKKDMLHWYVGSNVISNLTSFLNKSLLLVVVVVEGTCMCRRLWILVRVAQKLERATATKCEKILRQRVSKNCFQRKAIETPL